MVEALRILQVRGAFSFMEWNLARFAIPYLRPFAFVRTSRISLAGTARCFGEDGVHPSTRAATTAGMDIPDRSQASKKAFFRGIGRRTERVVVGMMYTIYTIVCQFASRCDLTLSSRL